MADDRPALRIDNARLGGGALAVGLAALLAAAAGLAWLGLAGGARDGGATDWPATLLWAACFLALAVVGARWALWAVLWVELGDRLTYRRLTGTRSRPWSDVRAVVFETRRGGLRLLTVLPADGRWLAVRVSPEQEARARALLTGLRPPVPVADAPARPAGEPG
jgi:hypothetical protein